MTLPTDAARMLSNELVATGAPLVSVIVHGSAVLGGWTAGRSDLDLLVIVEDDIDPADLRNLIAILVRFDPEANGMQLEASIVTRRAAIGIRDTWPFLAHVNSQRTQVIEDALPPPGASDPDLLMHYAVARHAGLAVSGEPAQAVIGPVSRSSILRYLAEELRWGIEHGTAGYALLNACRARLFLERGEIVSKIEGGRRALDDPDAPHTMVGTALAWQRGSGPEPVLDQDTRRFILGTARALAAASND